MVGTKANRIVMRRAEMLLLKSNRYGRASGSESPLAKAKTTKVFSLKWQAIARRQVRAMPDKC